MAQDFVEHISTIVVADEDTASAAFQIRKDAVFVGLLIPNIDAADVTLTVCATSGGTFVPVLDPLDGADLVLLASGEDPAFIDISNYIMSVPSTYYFKLAFSAAQNGGPYNVTLLEKS